MESALGALPLDKYLMTLVASLVGGSASLLLTETYGSLAMGSPLITDSQLSTLLKCSAQHSGIFWDQCVPICTEEGWWPRWSETIDGLEIAVEVPHVFSHCIGLDGISFLTKSFIIHTHIYTCVRDSVNVRYIYSFYLSWYFW